MTVSRAIALIAISAAVAQLSAAETAKRLVVVKVDGLPADFVERYMDRVNPETGRYMLPSLWRVFVERGTWVQNFYVRGISLSAPSWSMLDTGRHLAIRGNAEFDRAYPRVYDYLNFFPFYVGYARSHRADMPGVETLDECGIDLLIDSFPFRARYEGMQLFQRGVHWQTLGVSLKNQIARPVRDLIDEWQTGFDFSDAIMEQQERELIAKLADPKILYLDYYSGDFDHTAHLSNDEATQLNELRRVDATVGRIAAAIQSSPLAADTVLVLVSDHGMTSTPGSYSQGYDLVQFFNSAPGGSHHVITNRHPRDQYKLSGLDPFVSWVTTRAPASTYLAGQKDYPTALLDLDGNERASVQLRNSDLNAIHILLLQLAKPGIAPAMRSAIANEIIRIVDRNRPSWSATVKQLGEELAAVHAAIEQQRPLVDVKQRWSKDDRELGRKLDADRRAAAVDDWERDERGYTAYMHSLERLLSLKPADLNPLKTPIESFIPKAVMGEPNSPGQLQRYIAGSSGMTLNPDGELDENESFAQINYFAALTGARVRNAIVPAFGSAPVDFVAARIPRSALTGSLDEADLPEHDAIFLYRDPADEAILLTQHRGGELWLRYMPIARAFQTADEFRFERGAWNPGLPLKMFEDPDLQIAGDRAAWLNSWHSEQEWFNAVHRTRYSNAVIGLDEYFRPWEPQSLPDIFKTAPEKDCPALERFVARLRRSVQPDMLVLANYGWNFNVRSFNPGGNHGSFFRISTHSVLMMAGAGVPSGLRVEQPYDSLSFVPTLFALLGKTVAGFPYEPIPEIVTAQNTSARR